MAAQILDGKRIAADLRARVAAAARDLESAHGLSVGLAVVLVGEDPASQVYVRAKVRETQAAGMRSFEVRLSERSREHEVVSQIRMLTADPGVDGILVQLPLPGHIAPEKALAAIDPEKDVDGLTEISAGRLAQGRPSLRPCTPAGCVILAKEALGPDLAGAHVVVIGRSILVGRPAAQLFLAENCTITLAHSRSRDLARLCREADILVPAIGRPQMVRGEWIKPGACVIDVGINRVPGEDGKTRLVGDVAFEEAREQAGWITPVPGGVGPMTIACLLRNTILAACLRRGLSAPRGL